MAVATIVWSSAARRRATSMPASVKFLSLEVTVYIKCSFGLYSENNILAAREGVKEK
jgi:hypothetical protein